MRDLTAKCLAITGFCQAGFAAAIVFGGALRGAGDTFAGGFLGFLASRHEIRDSELRRAIIFGSVLASFTVEKFSLDRLRGEHYGLFLVCCLRTDHACLSLNGQRFSRARPVLLRLGFDSRDYLEWQFRVGARVSRLCWPFH